MFAMGNSVQHHDRNQKERSHHRFRHTLFQLYLLLGIPITCLLTMTYFRTYHDWISRGELSSHSVMVVVQILSLVYIISSIICGLAVLFHKVWACRITQAFLLLSAVYPIAIYLLQMKNLRWHLHSPLIGFLWVLIPSAINGALWFMHTRSEQNMQIDRCQSFYKQHSAHRAQEFS